MAARIAGYLVYLRLFRVQLGSLVGHEVHKTVKFEPPRTPRTRRSEAAFTKGAISRNRTELPGRPAISSWRLGSSIRMGQSSPLSFTRRMRSLATSSEQPHTGEARNEGFLKTLNSDFDHGKHGKGQQISFRVFRGIPRVSIDRSVSEGDGEQKKKKI